MKRALLHGLMAGLFVTSLGVSGVLADPGSYGHGKDGGEHGGGYGGGHKMGMMHGGTGHFITHLIKHEKEIGLSAEQVDKLKGLQSALDATRKKAEDDMKTAEQELRGLVKDDKSDMGAIESKLKQSTDLQMSLRLAAIKTRRDALAVLTPEQRAKEQAEHDKVMKDHRGKGDEHGKGHDNPHHKSEAH